MVIEVIKFLIFSLLIVGISKYALVPLLRKLGETLNLKSKAIGTIAGVATSVPELLTVSFSAFSGMIGTSAYNILSSNIINFIQYLVSVAMNKNRKGLQNKAIRIDIGMVLVTIFIPVAMLVLGMEENITMVPIFLLLFVFFYFINHNAHKLYIKKVASPHVQVASQPHESRKLNFVISESSDELSEITKKQKSTLEQEIEKETKWLKGKKRKTVLYVILLILTGIALYVVGAILGEVLENLCFQFKVPEFIIGILLGIITSLPELITFLEAQKYHTKQQQEELGLIEATNNLLSSNLLNLFIIQSIGILIFHIV